MEKKPIGRPRKATSEEAAAGMIRFRARGSYRKGLEQAAEMAGRSLSEECEYRLAKSLDEGASIANVFGDPAHRDLLIAIGNASRYADQLSDGDDKDGGDRAIQVQAAIIGVVQAFAGGVEAFKILDKASTTGHGWRWSAARVYELEKSMEKGEADDLVDPDDRARREAMQANTCK